MIFGLLTIIAGLANSQNTNCAGMQGYKMYSKPSLFANVPRNGNSNSCQMPNHAIQCNAFNYRKVLKLTGNFNSTGMPDKYPLAKPVCSVFNEKGKPLPNTCMDISNVGLRFYYPVNSDVMPEIEKEENRTAIAKRKNYSAN